MQSHLRSTLSDKDISFTRNGKKVSFKRLRVYSPLYFILVGNLKRFSFLKVPWSEEFVDMRSATYPPPYLKTKFKMRWNDKRLYIAAHLEETNLWATKVEHDSPVYRDNGFEVLMDVDGSLFNYKQVQINVLGTMVDQILYKSPWDAKVNETVLEKEWHPDVQQKVYAEGTINTPGDIDRYWNVEMSFSFQALAKSSLRVVPEPSDNDVWFIQFGRSEQKLNVSADNKYFRIPRSKTDWWSWQPCDAINLHLQDRWGLVQFKRKLEDTKFSFQKWHIYKSLFDMMDAMKKYKALHGRYTDEIQELDIPPYLLSGTCVSVPEIKLKNRNGIPDFDVIVKSKFLSHKPAHIRSDRYVTFE